MDIGGEPPLGERSGRNENNLKNKKLKTPILTGWIWCRLSRLYYRRASGSDFSVASSDDARSKIALRSYGLGEPARR